MKAPVYLDYAATTPVDPVVAEQMLHYLTPDGIFANPASRAHRLGWQAEEAVDMAREQVAQLLNADPREIVFTSGATESDNLALKGVVNGYRGHTERQELITVSTEHKAVVDTCDYLASQGIPVHWLGVQPDGRIKLAELEQALSERTLLVSIMHVNNETGVIQDIPAIAALCKQYGALLHVDAAQSVGKIAVDVRALEVDLLSVSAHKMYGPKGIGALYVRRRPKVRLAPEIHGGGHERGMRSGTLPTHQIVGFGAAAAQAQSKLAAEAERLTELREHLWQGLAKLPGVKRNGAPEHSVPGILNLSFADVESETLLMSLSELAVSSGSACTSATVEPSHVLTAMGVPRELALSSVRFSLGRFTTTEEVDLTIDTVSQTLPGLQQMTSPWGGI